jgi:hypothetical protein
MTSTTVIPKLNIESDSAEEDSAQQQPTLQLPKRNIKKLTLERPKFYTMYSSDASRFPTLERIENNIKNNKLDSSTEIASSKKGTANNGTQVQLFFFFFLCLLLFLNSYFKLI